MSVREGAGAVDETMAGTPAPSRPTSGWALLHSKLPAAAITPLSKDVYGVEGLSDVNEGYLIRRLFKSELSWDWRIVRQEYLGAEDRAVRGKDYTMRYYLAAVHGELNIEGRMFHGSGASDNRKVDAAFKGAATVAFKNACKWAGLTAELFLEGKAIDDIHQARQTSKAETVAEIVDWAEKASQAGTDGGAQSTPSPQVPASPSQSPEALGSPSPPKEKAPVSSETGELDLQPLFDLGRSLPNEPLTALEITAMVAARGYKGARAWLLLDHGRQCKSNACIHVAVAAGLK